ncbi:hypothetical protein ACFL58_01515 [Elusimicrobiota bacterium]
MTKDPLQKIDEMSKVLVRLKELEKEGRSLIEKMSSLQMEFENINLKPYADKAGEIFSNDSKNQDLLKAMIHDLEIEINQIKNTLPKQKPPEK